MNGEKEDKWWREKNEGIEKSGGYRKEENWIEERNVERNRERYRKNVGNEDEEDRKEDDWSRRNV